ncbi:MAG: YvrJ family protein [Fretibacterium sp.]|nr:YvrJ family protein [Fretibacterium sp.]
MDVLLETVVKNGFSVAVAAFLLIRMERELRGLKEAIDRLRHCQTCRLSPFAELDWGWGSDED